MVQRLGQKESIDIVHLGFRGHGFEPHSHQTDDSWFFCLCQKYQLPVHQCIWSPNLLQQYVFSFKCPT